MGLFSKIKKVFKKVTDPAGILSNKSGRILYDPLNLTKAYDSSSSKKKETATVNSDGTITTNASTSENPEEQAFINSTNMWNYYQKNYKPVIQKYIKKSTNASVQNQELRSIGGKINADIMQKVDARGSASTNALDNTLGTSQLAKGKTQAQLAGKMAVKQRQLGDLQNIVNIGAGQETTAQVGLSNLANQAVDNYVTDRNTELETNGANANAVGSAAGGIAGLYYSKKK
jgi:hypothetical protein